jgi:hypothetical protein
VTLLGGGACILAMMSNPELTKVLVAGAGGQVIEPLLRFRERHFKGRDSLQNVGGWTPRMAGIRILLEYTSAQHIQNAGHGPQTVKTFWNLWSEG